MIYLKDYSKLEECISEEINKESKLAKSSFFNSDGYFKIAEYMHFCNHLLIPEPKEKGKAPAMIVFCAFEQIQTVVQYGKQYGFNHYYPLFFCKNYSAQVLKAKHENCGSNRVCCCTISRQAA